MADQPIRTCMDKRACSHEAPCSHHLVMDLLAQEIADLRGLLKRVAAITLTEEKESPRESQIIPPLSGRTRTQAPALPPAPAAGRLVRR